MEYWSAGVLERWSIGVVEHRIGVVLARDNGGIGRNSHRPQKPLVSPPNAPLLQYSNTPFPVFVFAQRP